MRCDLYISVKINSSTPLRFYYNRASLVQNDCWAFNFHISFEVLQFEYLRLTFLSLAVDLKEYLRILSWLWTRLICQHKLKISFVITI